MKMSATATFAIKQLQTTFHGGAWHGPAVMEVLEGVTHEQAAARPIANGNTIWQLVHHLAFTMDLVRARLHGDERLRSDEEHWPPVTHTSESGWQKSLGWLKRSHEELVKAVEEHDGDLNEEFPAGMGVTHAARLHGCVEHNCYHAGQIAHLRKLIPGG